MVGQIGRVIGNVLIVYVWGLSFFFVLKTMCVKIEGPIYWLLYKNNNSINFILMLSLLSK